MPTPDDESSVALSAPQDPVPSTPDASPDPYAAVADQVAGQHKAMLRESLRIAAQGSPDAAAKAQDVARQTGIPAPVAAREPVAAQGAVIAQRADDLAAKHPELAKWLSGPGNAAVAHDDLDNLTSLDHVLGSLQADRSKGPVSVLPPGFIFTRSGQIMENLGSGQAMMYDSLDQVTKEMYRRGENAFADDLNRQASAQRFMDSLGGSGGGWNPLPHFIAGIVPVVEAAHVLAPNATNREADTSGQDIEQASTQAAPGVYGGLTRMAGGLLGSGAFAGGAIAPAGEAIYTASRARALIGAVAGAKAATWGARAADLAAAAAPMNAPGALLEGRDQGATAGLTDFLASSGIMAATGGAGLPRILASPIDQAAIQRGWGPAATEMLKQSGLMAGQNAAMTVSQAIEHSLFSGEPIDQKQLFEEIAKSGELGAAAGAIFAVAPTIGHKFHADAIAAMGSLNAADKLTMALKMVQESKLAKRSPESMNGALTAMLGDGSQDRNVYFQADDWTEHWTKQGIDPVVKAREAGIEQQLTEAKATGGQMSVPLPTYLQTLADSANGPDMIAKTRVAPEAMTPTEAAQFHDQTPDQIKDIYHAAEEAVGQAQQEAFAHPAIDAIHDDVAKQISAARPHWGADMVDKIATVYARVLAGVARFGSVEGAEPINPLDLHQKISIGSELPESVRTKGFEAIKQMMEAIQSGKDAQSPEMEKAMGDLAAHVEAVGGAVDEHALGSVKAMMDREAAGSGFVDRSPGAPVELAKAERRSITELIPHMESRDTTNLRTELEAYTNKDARAASIHDALERVLRSQVTGLVPGRSGWPKEFRILGSDGVERPGELSSDDASALQKEIRWADAERTKKIRDLRARIRESVAGDRSEIESRRTKYREYTASGGALGEVYAEHLNAADSRFEQPSRGSIEFNDNGTARINLGPSADASTVIHELGHYALETLTEFGSRPDASPQLKRDLQTLYDHIGIKDQAEWDAKSGEERTPAHEKFAASFESYMQEGKAPIPELRSVFRKIRNLIVGVYKTLRPLVRLSPEVRDVFDRLVAADEEIHRARAEIGSRGIFKTVEESGMSPEAFAAYIKGNAAELETDRARGMDATANDMARRLTDTWKEEEGRVRAEHTALINGRPEFSAMDHLMSGEWPAGARPEGSEDQALKLDRADLVKRYGEDALKDLPGRAGFSRNPNRGSPLYAAKDGLDLDATASILGFKSGDELWQALTQAGPRDQMIDKATQREMDRRHPPTEASEDDVMDILHGASANDRMLKELNSLGKMVGQSPPPVELLRLAADKQIAARDVRAINPNVYRRAEAKAFQEVIEAMAKGDRPEAYRAQVRRILSAELYRAAADAKTAIAKAVDYVRKFDKSSTREAIGKAGGWEWQAFQPNGKPALDEKGNPLTFDNDRAAAAWSRMNDNAPYLRTSSYLGQIDSLRERFGLARGKTPGNREALSAFIVEQHAKAMRGGLSMALDPSQSVSLDTSVVIPDWIAHTSDQLDFRDLSYEKFSDVVDSIRNIEHMAKDANKISALINKGLLDQRIGELSRASDANKQRVAKNYTAKGVGDKVRDGIANADAWLTQLGTQLRIMDGHKNGGVWWDTFERPLQEAHTRGAEMDHADAAALKKLADDAGYNDQSGRLYRREYVPEIQDHLTLENRLMIAAYYGREEGRERLLSAHWTDDQIHRLILDRLTAKDRDFIAGVVKLFDGKFPDLRAQQQRLSGIDVERSKAAPFANAAGVEFQGGYIPIKYDPRANPRGEALVEAANVMEANKWYRTAKTKDSMLKQTATTTGMKLRLDLSVISTGLREANHRLSHQDVLTDMAKIIGSKEMTATIVRNHGKDAYDLIRDTLTDVAIGPKTEDLGFFGKSLRWLRTGVPAAAFGFNAMRAFLDVAESLPQAMLRVPPQHIAAAMAKMMASAFRLESFAKQIASKSGVMADRQRTSLRAQSDAFNGARVAGKIREGYDQLAQAVMHQAHLVTDHIVWQAAHDHALTQGHDDAKAVQIADSVVQSTQSSYRLMNQSKFQRRGGELTKMFSVAYGFFGAAYQQQKLSVSQFRSGPTSPMAVAKLATAFITLYSLPIAIDYMLKASLKGTQDNKEKSAKEIAMELGFEHLAYGAAMVPGLREMSGALNSQGSYSGPAGDRGINALYGVFQSSKSIFTRMVEDKPEPADRPGLSQGERQAIMAAGVLFHLPATQVQRMIDGHAYAEEHGLNPIMPMITGKPPKK